MGHRNQRPEIKLVLAFMPVLVTSNFDDDSIKSERASMETPFSHFKSMGNFFRRSRTANSVVNCPIWSKFKLIRDFMHVLVTWKYKKDRIKNKQKRWRHHFPHYKSMGAFCCHGNHSFDPVCLKTLCSLSPSPVMLMLHKIGSKLANWHQRFSSLKVWTTMDHWYTDNGVAGWYCRLKLLGW